MNQVKESTEDTANSRCRNDRIKEIHKLKLELDKERNRYCVTPGCIRATSRLISNMNLNATPCNDFWAFSCGGWMQRHEDGHGIMQELEKRTQEQVTALLQQTPSASEAGETFQSKVSTLYGICMDEGQHTVDDGIYELNEILDIFGGWSSLGNRLLYVVTRLITMHLFDAGATAALAVFIRSFIK